MDRRHNVRASHLLVKHRDSRRPSSWKEPAVTRTKVLNNRHTNEAHVTEHM